MICGREFGVEHFFDDECVGGGAGNQGTGVKKVTDGFSVLVDCKNSSTEIPRIAFHIYRVFIEVGVFKQISHVSLQCSVMATFRIQNQTRVTNE